MALSRFPIKKRRPGETVRRLFFVRHLVLLNDVQPEIVNEQWELLSPRDGWARFHSASASPRYKEQSGYQIPFCVRRGALLRNKSAARAEAGHFEGSKKGTSSFCLAV